jgi:hypothetical protein
MFLQYENRISLEKELKNSVKKEKRKWTLFSLTKLSHPFVKRIL